MMVENNYKVSFLLGKCGFKGLTWDSNLDLCVWFSLILNYLLILMCCRRMSMLAVGVHSILGVYNGV